LLVAPIGGKKGEDENSGGGKGDKNAKLWDSSDEETSSEEDFGWLEEKIKSKQDLTP